MEAKCGDCGNVQGITKSELTSRFRPRCVNCGGTKLERYKSRNKAETPGRGWVLTFGKYQGELMQNVPREYLIWLAGLDWSEISGTMLNFSMAAHSMLYGESNKKQKRKTVKCKWCKLNPAPKKKTCCRKCKREGRNIEPQLPKGRFKSEAGINSSQDEKTNVPKLKLNEELPPSFSSRWRID